VHAQIVGHLVGGVVADPLVCGGHRRRSRYLVAPLVLQQFPDRFVDGRASLLSFAAAGALLALLLVWLSVDGTI